MNQNKSKARYQMEFVFMVFFLLLGLACISGMIIGLNVPGMEWLMSYHGIPLVLSFAACIATVIAIGRFYRIHKDEASYDEFGIRKDEKRRMEMDSKERRKLELQSLMELEKVLPRNTLEQITKKGSSNPEKDIEFILPRFEGLGITVTVVK